MRSAAEGEHRTGEDVGEAVPLMPLEAIQPFGKGEVKGNARRACPRSQSGKNRRGMQPEGGCPSGAGTGSRNSSKTITIPTGIRLLIPNGDKATAWLSCRRHQARQMVTCRAMKGDPWSPKENSAEAGVESQRSSSTEGRGCARSMFCML